MRQVKIIDKEGNCIATLPLYESLYDVPLRCAVDFLHTSKPLHAKEEEEVKQVNLARVMAESVCAFYELKLEDVLSAAGISDGDELKAFESLFFKVAELLGSFRGNARTLEQCRFDIAGEQFHLPAFAAGVMLSLPVQPKDLTVQEAIEAYEIARIAQARMSGGEDADGSALYTYYLNLCAVLLRKEGERLPHSEVECERFIQERSAFFHNAPLSAGIALDVDFFLASMMRPYELTGAAVGFFSNRLFSLVAATAALGRLKSKRTTTPSSAQKRPSSALAGGTFTLN
jgi:hypothetical protein